MSIRLRLTLLYSTILTLTLIVFGVALYSIQAQDTINSLEQDLVLSSDRLTEAVLRAEGSPLMQEPVRRAPPPPQPFNEFSSDQAFLDLREREIVRILDSAGNLVASPFGREEDALPLSEEGLTALQSQQDWWEDEIVSDEHMLIFSRPLVQNGETVYILQVARSLAERDRTLKSLATTLGAIGLITILIAFGVGWTLSGMTLQPIHRITQTAQEMARSGTLRVVWITMVRRTKLGAWRTPSIRCSPACKKPIRKWKIPYRCSETLWRMSLTNSVLP